MFSKSRLTLVITIATLAFAAPVATAVPIDARGEHAKSQTQATAAPSSGGFADLRSPDAVQPFERPVIVEVGGPVPSSGIDWSAVLIGLGAGAALVLLATAGVVTTRRRHAAV